MLLKIYCKSIVNIVFLYPNSQSNLVTHTSINLINFMGFLTLGSSPTFKPIAFDTFKDGL